MCLASLGIRTCQKRQAQVQPAQCNVDLFVCLLGTNNVTIYHAGACRAWSADYMSLKSTYSFINNTLSEGEEGGLQSYMGKRTESYVMRRED